jgi:hypothetical protein
MPAFPSKTKPRKYLRRCPDVFSVDSVDAVRGARLEPVGEPMGDESGEVDESEDRRSDILLAIPIITCRVTRPSAIPWSVT